MRAGEGARVGGAPLERGEDAGFEFERHEGFAGIGCVKQFGEKAREAELRVVGGVAQHDDQVFAFVAHADHASHGYIGRTQTSASSRIACSAIQARSANQPTRAHPARSRASSPRPHASACPRIAGAAARQASASVPAASTATGTTVAAKP